MVVASALWANLAGGAKWVAYLLAVIGWALTFFLGTIRFTFFGVDFQFRAYIPMLGGIFNIATSCRFGNGQTAAAGRVFTKHGRKLVHHDLVTRPHGRSHTPWYDQGVKGKATISSGYFFSDGADGRG